MSQLPLKLDTRRPSGNGVFPPKNAGQMRERKSPTKVSAKRSSPTVQTPLPQSNTKRLKIAILVVASLVIIAAIIGIAIYLTTKFDTVPRFDQPLINAIKPDFSADHPSSEPQSSPEVSGAPKTEPSTPSEQAAEQPLIAGLQEAFSYSRGLLIGSGSKWQDSLANKCDQDSMVFPPGIKIKNVFSTRKMLKFIPGKCVVSRDFDVPYGVGNNKELYMQFSTMFENVLLQPGQGISLQLKFKNTAVVPNISLLQEGGNMFLKGSDISSRSIILPVNAPSHIVFKISRVSGVLNFFATLNPPLDETKVAWVSFGSSLATTVVDTDLIFGNSLSILSIGDFPTPNKFEINIGDIRINSEYKLAVIEDQSIMANKINVVIISGQSNADGRARTYATDTEYTKNYKDIYVDGLMTFDSSRGIIDFTSPGVNNNCFGAGNRNDKDTCIPGIVWGSELKLGSLLHRFYGSKGNSMILKYAIGGTGLICRKTDYSWSVDCPGNSVPEYKLYNRLMNYINTARSMSKKFGWELEFKGMTWMQGESDTGGFSEFSYRTELKKLILQIRKDISSPEMPFVIGRIGGLTSHHNPASSTFSVINDAGSLEIRKAQENTALETYKTKMISTDTFQVQRDAVHFQGAGVLKMGQAWFDALKEFL